MKCGRLSRLIYDSLPFIGVWLLHIISNISSAATLTIFEDEINAIAWSISCATPRQSAFIDYDISP